LPRWVPSVHLLASASGDRTIRRAGSGTSGVNRSTAGRSRSTAVAFAAVAHPLEPAGEPLANPMTLTTGLADRGTAGFRSGSTAGRGSSRSGTDRSGSRGTARGGGGRSRTARITRSGTGRSRFATGRSRSTAVALPAVTPKQTGISDIDAGDDQQGSSQGSPLHLEFSSTFPGGWNVNFVCVRSHTMTGRLKSITHHECWVHLPGISAVHERQSSFTPGKPHRKALRQPPVRFVTDMQGTDEADLVVPATASFPCHARHVTLSAVLNFV
jgi:hypothetical protein